MKDGDFGDDIDDGCGRRRVVVGDVEVVDTEWMQTCREWMPTCCEGAKH